MLAYCAGLYIPPSETVKTEAERVASTLLFVSFKLMAVNPSPSEKSYLESGCVLAPQPTTILA